MWYSRRDVLKWLGAIGFASLVPALRAADQPSQWSLATFQLDVTPPVGHRLLGNLFAPSKSIADPLEARGFVLVGPDQPIVLISIDWCELRNDAFDMWRQQLAEAAGTTVERVLVHTVHQHDAPYFDLTAQRLLGESEPGGIMLDAQFHAECVQRAADALKESLTQIRPVTHIGIGQAEVEQVASNRRVDENGKVSYRRLSRCADAALRELPEGQIDPWLKSISFWHEDQAMAVLSVYACHPMSYYGYGEISGDFPNMARKLRDVSTPRVFQIYANGCCGDVTAGKYNDGSRPNRPIFAERLAKAMEAAWQATQRHPLKAVTVRHEEMILPHSELESMSEAALRRILDQDRLTLNQRVQAALGLSSLMRNADGHHITVPLIDFGVAQLILLPAESFVAYQLFAQQQRPDSFVVTLGFGESAPGYIPTNQAYQEGFRQEHQYTWNRPGAEDIIQATLQKLLHH